MKEDFLHYLWKFGIFNTLDLKTTSGETIVILNVGQYLEQAGPDFFNAQIRIDNQKWAGNVEIHLKSSDWYAHHHENDPAYENVILHVVWENDVAIYRSDNSIIPVLEIKQYVAPETVIKYNALRSVKSWLFCENQLTGLDQFLLRHWQERLFIERLEQKQNLFQIGLRKLIQIGRQYFLAIGSKFWFEYEWRTVFNHCFFHPFFDNSKRIFQFS